MPEIVAYNSLTGTSANDVLPIVDVTDPTMSAAGTTKKITVAALLAGTTSSAALTAETSRAETAEALLVPAAALTGALPAGAFAQTFPPLLGFFGASPVSGTLQLAAVTLPAGLTVTHITVASAGTAAAGQSHWWYTLHDASRVMLAQTADQTAGGFPVFTAQPLPVARTAAGLVASFTTTYTGVHYLGFQMTATTPCDLNFTGGSSNIPIAGIPVIGGRSTTGLTVPPGFSFTAGALTTSQSFYGYVS